jgi:phosphatidylglycerol:prolipoprotein diacylglycerol transferase
VHAIAYYLHNLDPFIFQVTETFGPRWYGMAYVAAFASGYALMLWLSKRGYADLPQRQVGDFITWAALFGVMLGGRLGYVFFYKPHMLVDPLSILRIWEGGMSSHGGILGLVLFTLYYSRRHKISWTNLGDNLCVTAPIGLFFGRCANFINGELYGRPSTLPWAVQFPKTLFDADNADQAQRVVDLAAKVQPPVPGTETLEGIIQVAQSDDRFAEVLRNVITPRHPSQIYEALVEGALLFLILWLVRTRMRQPNGVITGLFLGFYAIGRIIVEYWREPDSGMIGMFTRGQFFSFFLVALGFAFIVAARMRPVYPVKLSGR